MTAPHPKRKFYIETTQQSKHQLKISKKMIQISVFLVAKIH